jgi:hypothetical protein
LTKKFFFSLTKYFATCIAKQVNLLITILANYNNISLFNSINIDTKNLCLNLKQKYSSLFDISYNNSKFQWLLYSSVNLNKFEDIDNLSIHLYDDTISELKEERSMQNL